MFTESSLLRITRSAILVAVCGGLAAPTALALDAQASMRTGPDALLTIDQNRATVIDRIVADWGEALTRSNAGIDSGQLRQLLERMRADHLLAASLAGSLEGLRSVITGAQSGQPKTLGKSDATIKALGDTADDVVYTPVTPCRLVETRGTYPAVYQGDGTPSHTAVPFNAGEIRNYTLLGGNGVCLSQLPSGLNPAAVQVQVFAIPVNGVSGDVEVLPQGSAFGSTATLVFLGNLSFTSAGTTARANQGSNQIGVQVRSGVAHIAMDVVGYFAAPVATAVQCTQVASASTPIAVSSDTLVALPSCAAGYTRTGSNCSGTANVPGGYLVETNTTGCLFRNLSAVATYNATATSICCRIPGR